MSSKYTTIVNFRHLLHELCVTVQLSISEIYYRMETSPRTMHLVCNKENYAHCTTLFALKYCIMLPVFPCGPAT